MRKKNRKLLVPRKSKGEINAGYVIDVDFVRTTISCMTEKEWLDLACACSLNEIPSWAFFRICVLAFIHNDPEFMTFFKEFYAKLLRYGGTDLRKAARHAKGSINLIAAVKRKAMKTLELYGIDNSDKAAKMFDVSQGIEAPLHTDISDPLDQAISEEEE